MCSTSWNPPQPAIWLHRWTYLRSPVVDFPRVRIWQAKLRDGIRFSLWWLRYPCHKEIGLSLIKGINLTKTQWIPIPSHGLMELTSLWVLLVHAAFLYLANIVDCESSLLKLKHGPICLHNPEPSYLIMAHILDKEPFVEPWNIEILAGNHQYQTNLR